MHLVLHVTGRRSGASNVSQIPGKSSGVCHHLPFGKAVLLPKILLVGDFEGVDQLRLSLESLILIRLLFRLTLLLVAFQTPFIVGQMETVVEYAQLLCIDFAAADNFHISGFLRL